ncbi:MAG: hypothetical protein OHK0015_47440 [Chloroflexi bacterium OHK40]
MEQVPQHSAAPMARTAPVLALAALTLGIGAMLAWLSVLRYAGFNAGMLDLGNMAQAIASVPRGRPLEFTYKEGEMSRLAFHVELIYLLFAPLYALWPDPRTLLIGQALLAASGAIPAYRLAGRRLGSPWAGLAVALIYLLYPVAQTGVLFDFHGDTLAMPLLLWSVEALDRRAWRAYILWLALALASKFYVAAPVALMGLVIWRWERAPRAGLLTAMAGLAYGALAFLLIRPLFTTGATSEAHRGLSYLSYYFGTFANLAGSLEPRLINALIVFGPALLAGLRGWRWLLPGLPIAAAALLSTGPGSSFDYRYHHYAMAVPFLVLAIIDGAARTSAPARRWIVLGATLAITVAANLVFVSTPLSPLRWSADPGMALDHTVYGRTPRDAVKEQFIREFVPTGEPIAASIFLAPRLASRETLYSLRYPDDPGPEALAERLPRVRYALADALFDYRVVNGNSVAGGPAYEAGVIAALLREPAFGLVAARDGLLLFQREPPPDSALEQHAAIVNAPILPATPADLGPVALLGARVEHLGGRRFRAEFEWQLSGTERPAGPWAAVSRLGGRDDARIVHLPTFALLPIGSWAPGQIVRERFELVIPADLPPGDYPWSVAWYDLTHPEAAFTDERALPPAIQPVVVATLTLR